MTDEENSSEEEKLEASDSKVNVEIVEIEKAVNTTYTEINKWMAEIGEVVR